jgi:hypothetical protein
MIYKEILQMKKIMILTLLPLVSIVCGCIKPTKNAAPEVVYEQPKVVHYLPKRDEEIEYWMS